MPSDPSMPLLRLEARAAGERRKGTGGHGKGPERYPVGRQKERFGPHFDRLAKILARDPTGLELRADPTALAPERLLVFEVRGAVQNFANAVRNVPGLELVDEEELGADENDKTPVVYLMVPDASALGNILSLWTAWQAGRPLARGGSHLG